MDEKEPNVKDESLKDKWGTRMCCTPMESNLWQKLGINEITTVDIRKMHREASEKGEIYGDGMTDDACRLAEVQCRKTRIRTIQLQIRELRDQATRLTETADSLEKYLTSLLVEIGYDEI